MIKIRIWFMRKFFPEYRRMSAKLYEMSQEIYSLNNMKAEQTLLIETQTASITALKLALQEKQTQIVELEKLLNRGGKRKK